VRRVTAPSGQVVVAVGEGRFAAGFAARSMFPEHCKMQENARKVRDHAGKMLPSGAFRSQSARICAGGITARLGGVWLKV
jgi:hypothetical protein